MTTETTTPAPSQTNTIHDAIDALFAEKAAAPAPAVKPAEAAAPAVTPAAAAAPEGETPAEVPAEAAPAEVKPEPPKMSAADYAIKLARARKKLADAEAKAAPAATQPNPSAEAIKRAAAIEAAGGDPLKAFEAAGLDLKAVVQAYEKRVLEEPEYPDPLAKEMKVLSDRLAQYERREQEAKDAATVREFVSAAEQMVKAKGEEFEFVAANGADGIELVKELVLEAAQGGEVLLLSEALKLAEAHYADAAAKLAKTKKLAKQFQSQPQTKKPGLPQQSSAAGTAPAKATAPRSVQDVINESIDALLGV